MVTTNRMVSSDGHIPILDDVFAESSRQRCPLGTALRFSDGRVFKYSKAGGSALIAGNLLQTPADIAAHLEDLAVTATAAGATVVNVTPGATAGAENLYQDGFLFVHLAAGLGHNYSIKSHLAITASTAFNVNLYDAIKVALTTSSKVGLRHNSFNGVIQMPATKTGVPVGAAPAARTAAYFGWIQTWGMCAVLKSAAAETIVGNEIIPSAATAGAFDATVAATVLPSIGAISYISTAAETPIVYLRISP